MSECILAAYLTRFDDELIKPLFRKLADQHYRRLYRNLSLRKKVAEKRVAFNVVVYGTSHPEIYKS